MPIENMQEFIDYAQANKDSQELSTALESAGLIKTVEKEVIKEVEAKYTEEGVNNFLKDNQGFRDKLYNSNRDNVYKKLLGLEKDAELTEEQRQTKFVSESMLTEQKQAYAKLEKESKIINAIGEENYNKFNSMINLDSITKDEEGNWSGIDSLQELFVRDKKSTPPPAPQIEKPKSEQEKQNEKDGYMNYQAIKQMGYPIPENLKKFENK